MDTGLDSGSSRPSESEAKDRELAKKLEEFLDRRAQGRSGGSGESLEDLSTDALELGAELETLAEIESMLEDRTPLGPFGSDFRIMHEAGRGGMGIVYEAWQISLDRRVALKVLPANLLSDPKAVERFRREAKVAASLSHPNIVGVYSMGVEAGIPYYTMEFAEGQTLQQAQRRVRSSGTAFFSVEEPSRPVQELDGASGALFGAVAPPVLEGDLLSEALSPSPPSTQSLKTVADAFAGVADGLHHAHSKGVLHRDLKPSNLMLDSSGRLRILDFGLARVEGQLQLTRSSERLGTLPYMSPEQAAAEDSLGPGADIYSLGATFYEVLAGRPPFVAKQGHELYAQITLREPTALRRLRPGISRDLETIILKCLRKSPRDRYATAEALAQDLRRFARGDPIEARPQPLLEKAASRLWRSRRKVAEAAGIVALLIAFAIGLAAHLHGRSLARDERYRDSVTGAQTKLLERQIVPLASSQGWVQVQAVPGKVQTGTLRQLAQDDAEIRLRMMHWHHRKYSVGTLAVMAGPALAPRGPDPAEEAIDELRRAVVEFPEGLIGHYQLARAFLLQSRIADAWEPLRRALELDPTFVPALWLRVVLLERIGDPGAADARATLQNVVRVSGRGWESAWLEANEALMANDWERAAQAYDALLDGQAGSEKDEHFLGFLLEIRLGRGVARLRAGDSRASSDFDSASRARHGWFSPAILLGKALYLEGDARRAERVFVSAYDRVAAAGRPSSHDAARAIATTCIELEDFGAARGWASRMKPGIDRSLLEAEVLALEGRLDEARKLAAELAGREPGNAEASFTLGNILFQEGKYVEARSVYEKAGPAPDPRARVQIGLCFEGEEDLENALRNFDAASDASPSFAPGHYNAARVLAKLGREGQALARYRKLLEIEPGNALAHNNIGVLLDPPDNPDRSDNPDRPDNRDRSNNLERALEMYRSAVRFDPRLGLARYNLAWALQRKGRHAEAEVEYRLALANGLDDYFVHAHLAACLYHQGRFLEAAAEYTKVTKLLPDYAAAYQHLGACLYQLKARDDAYRAYQRAVELEPDWPQAHHGLGLALDFLGQTERALAEYRRATELEPSIVDVQNLLAGALLRTYQPLPSGDELGEDVRRWEEARYLDNAGEEIDCLLDVYRQAFLPRIASYASAEALLDRPLMVIPNGAEWSFLRGIEEPPPDWREETFDDSFWERSLAPFGYPRTDHARTVLDGMQGRYTSLYLRRRFTVAGDARAGLVLRIRADDAFVVYLNGKEIGRRGVKGEPPSHDATAEDETWNPFLPERIAIEPNQLKAGDNVLAVHGINLSRWDGDFFLDLTLEGGRVDEGEKAARALQLLETFGEASGPGDGELLTYLRGRELQLAGRHSVAAAEFRSLIAAGAMAAEPYLRMAECLRRAGSAIEGEELLRSALEAGVSSRKLWDEWLDLVLVDLQWDPEVILKQLPGGEESDARRMNIRWLLSELASKGSLRIDCGAKRSPKGSADTPWSRDRFFRSGQGADLDKVKVKGARDLPPMALTERYFAESGEGGVIYGYAIPLPPGVYQVVLHLGEGYFEEEGKRRFDVLLEGKVAVENYEPIRAGFGVPHRVECPVPVSDGALNVDFRRILQNPNILGLEVHGSARDARLGNSAR